MIVISKDNKIVDILAEDDSKKYQDGYKKHEYPFHLSISEIRSTHRVKDDVLVKKIYVYVKPSKTRLKLNESTRVEFIITDLSPNDKIDHLDLKITNLDSGEEVFAEAVIDKGSCEIEFLSDELGVFVIEVIGEDFNCHKGAITVS
jgi:hypothetical protein